MYNMMEVDAYDIIPQYHVIKSIDVQIEPYRPQTCQQSQTKPLTYLICALFLIHV